MFSYKNLLYVPALRAKAGEFKGLQKLAPDVSEKMIPHLIIPPPKDIDPEKQLLLTKDEIVTLTSRRIAEHWPMRPTFLDPRFLFREFSEDDSHVWLPRIFDAARRAGATAIPVFSIADAFSSRAVGFRKCLVSGTIKAAIRFKFDEVDQELAAHLSSLLTTMELTASDCVILADFSEADFAEPEVVGQIAQAVLEDLQTFGRWHAIVFQGTNYPIVNPAKDNSNFIVPRNEWLAWKSAVKLNGKSPDHLVFGDFAADCSKIAFAKAGGGIPIRHYRYTTPESWLVVRGVATGTARDAMQQVCIRILNSGQFAGPEFSAADEYIFRTAKGWDGPGNGTVWREINTTHHITRVVRDIGRIKGHQFADRRVSVPAEQPSIFEHLGGPGLR